MADWLQDVRTLARTLVVKLQHLLAVRVRPQALAALQPAVELLKLRFTALALCQQQHGGLERGSSGHVGHYCRRHQQAHYSSQVY